MHISIINYKEKNLQLMHSNKGGNRRREEVINQREICRLGGNGEEHGALV